MTSVDLTQYFPPLMSCQPWKINWFAEKLLQASGNTIDNFERVSYQAPVDIDKSPLLENFGRVLQLQKHVLADAPTGPSVDTIKFTSTILSKTNEYISRLDASPYFAELPFVTKARLMEPLIDMRIFASNLKRALKPCVVTPKPPLTPMPVTPMVPMTTLARGFL